MSKVMGIYVKYMVMYMIYMYISNMVMSRDPGSKFRKFLFSPNSILNFRKSYQIKGKLAQEQKSKTRGVTGIVKYI